MHESRNVWSSRTISGHIEVQFGTLVDQCHSVEECVISLGTVYNSSIMSSCHFIWFHLHLSATKVKLDVNSLTICADLCYKDYKENKIDHIDVQPNMHFHSFYSNVSLGLKTNEHI